MSMTELYLSPNGRIGRRVFWLQGVLAYLIVYAVAAVIDAVAGTGGIIGLVASLLLIWPSLMITIKRWHDRDKSGWWVLITFIPIIGAIWALVETGFLAGTPGPNRFGPPQDGTVAFGAQRA